VINIVLGIHGGIDGDVGGPFFYSRTCCCGASGTSLELPPHFDIWYPRTCNHYTMCKGGFNVTFVKACDVPWLNPEQPAWSHSPYCQNWDYVRDFTQRLGAGRRMSLTMTSLFCMPIGAGISDKTGRKPMYFFSFMLGVKSLLFNLISSTEWSIRTDPNGIILYISGFLSGMGSGAGPIGMAMMVDLIPGDMREQGFPIMSLFGVPGQIVVFAIGYMLLHKHLSHYTIFWEWSLGTDFICMLFVLFLMPETMPDSLRRPLDWWDFFPGTYYFYALRIIFNYPLLTGICPCIMLWSFSGNGMGSVAGNQLWMGPLSFRQEESLIPGLVGMICGIPANILGAIVIPRVGVWPAIFFGSFVGLALGLGSNIWPIFWMNYYHCWTGTRCGNGDWGTELFIAKWGGTMIGTVLGTFLGAISGPAGTAMISMQVKQTEQASIQAAFNLIGSLSGMYARECAVSTQRHSKMPATHTPVFAGSAILHQPLLRHGRHELARHSLRLRRLLNAAPGLLPLRRGLGYGSLDSPQEPHPRGVAERDPPRSRAPRLRRRLPEGEAVAARPDARNEQGPGQGRRPSECLPHAQSQGAKRPLPLSLTKLIRK